MTTTYRIRDISGRILYRRLVLGADGIYGWPTGGFIDPLDIRQFRWTVEREES